MAERICPTHGIIPVTEGFCPNVSCGKRAALADGTVLNGGTYTITRKVAEGGMATIYEAADNSGACVAIKEIRVIPDPADPNKIPTAQAKFEEEGRLLRSISSPHFPAGYNNWDEFGTKFMALEFIDGQDFEQIAMSQGGTMTNDEEILKFAIATLTGLEILHTQSVIHRDVKPANVMENSTGRIIVMDLGIGKQFNPAAGTATTIGTIGYAPLEQEAGRAEPRSDLYAAAMSIMRLKLGPHVITLDYDARLDEVDKLPLDWQGIMRRALAVLPDDRQSDVTEFKNDLLTLLPTPIPAAPPTQQLRPHRTTGGTGAAPAPAPVAAPVIALVFDQSQAAFHGRDQYRQPVAGTLTKDGIAWANAQIFPYIMDYGYNLIFTGNRQAPVITDNFGRFSLPSRLITVPLTVDRREITLKVPGPGTSGTIACTEYFTIAKPVQKQSWISRFSRTTPSPSTTGQLTPAPTPATGNQPAPPATPKQKQSNWRMVALQWALAILGVILLLVGLGTNNPWFYSIAPLVILWGLGGIKVVSSKGFVARFMRFPLYLATATWIGAWIMFAAANWSK